ncbi:unnamed protein product [Pocillopora meandrina]|uniref:Uncharacterized protein n=1 Tax=Pocillopora meandrina TaxID=46732 RepID=A0AAU9VUH1_9CNID|nr:unnamed protein product [Pocillopora meandrina]
MTCGKHMLHLHMEREISEGCPVFPRGFEENLPEEAKLVVKKIQQRHASSRACIVAAPSWRACINRREAYQQNIFCVFPVFNCQLRGLHLFILFKSRPTVR